MTPRYLPCPFSLKLKLLNIWMEDEGTNYSNQEQSPCIICTHIFGTHILISFLKSARLYIFFRFAGTIVPHYRAKRLYGVFTDVVRLGIWWNRLFITSRHTLFFALNISMATFWMLWWWIGTELSFISKSFKEVI